MEPCSKGIKMILGKKERLKAGSRIT